MVVQIWCKDVDSTFCLSHPLAPNKDVTKNNQPLRSEWGQGGPTENENSICNLIVQTKPNANKQANKLHNHPVVLISFQMNLLMFSQ